MATSAGGLTILLLIAASATANAQRSTDSDDFSLCRVQKLRNPSIRCQDDGSFSPLQCEVKLCWCVHRNGTRLNQMTFPRTDDVSDATCTNMPTCPVVRCSKQQYLRCGALGFAVSDAGCMTCECRMLCRPGILELQAMCGLRCIGYRDNCPYCRDGCNSSTTDEDVCMCSDDQVCVREGFGEATCRDRLAENTTCIREVDEEEGEVIEDDSRDIMDSRATSDEEDEEQREEKERARGLLVGTSARHTALTLVRASIECSTNDYCRRVGLTVSVCTPRETDGPCSSNQTAVMRDECDSNGFFKPRICRPGPREGTLICACVFPANGTRLSEVLVDQRSNDVALSRRPICIRKVYKPCTIRRFNRTITIQHGHTFVDSCGCAYCKCYLGQLSCTRRRSVCQRNCTTESCQLADGTQLAHGRSTQVDCNRCTCRSGTLHCTERDCDDTRNNTCSRCNLERREPVCGRNGRTYSSRCVAIHCARIPSIDIIDAPCPVVNPCDVFPCQDGEVCRRKGWSYCLARGGCKPDTVRVCVNITRLSCDDYNTTMDSDDSRDARDDGDIGSGDVEPSDTRVCGTDGITYGAVCQLLQRTADIDVHYAGRCNATNCRGGQVCGTDGITYDNICVLRSRSGGARVDYRGSCEEEETPRRICDAVNRGKRCEVRNNTDCRFIVRPSDGCCPICGGVLVLAIDRDRLADAADIDNGLGTVDGLMVRMVQDPVFENLQGRCEVEASLTETSNLEIVFRSKGSSDDDVMFCHEQATVIANVINEDSSVSSSSFQFAVAASTAPRSTTTTSPGPSTDPNGAGTLSALSLLTLTVAAALIAVFM